MKTYDEQMEERLKRRDEIRELNKYIGYRKISKIYGLTKERIRQIIRYEPTPKKEIDEKIYKSWLREGADYEHYNNLVHLKKEIGKVIKEGSRDQVREMVRLRDNHTCQMCLKKWEVGKRRFDVHHLDSELEGKSKERGASDTDRRNLHRLITLCHKCHFSLDVVKEKISKGSIK